MATAAITPIFSQRIARFLLVDRLRPVARFVTAVGFLRDLFAMATDYHGEPTGIEPPDSHGGTVRRLGGVSRSFGLRDQTGLTKITS
jgi:hypothetical protein